MANARRVCVFVCILTGLLPIDALLHMTNIGTLFAFVIVCAAVLVMRVTNPDAERPFRAPLYPYVPLAGILSCTLLMLSLPAPNWQASDHRAHTSESTHDSTQERAREDTLAPAAFSLGIRSQPSTLGGSHAPTATTARGGIKHACSAGTASSCGWPLASLSTPATGSITATFAGDTVRACVRVPPPASLSAVGALSSMRLSMSSGTVCRL